MRFVFMPMLALLCATGSAEARKINILMIGNSYTLQTWTRLRGFLKADPAVDAQITVHAAGGKKLSQDVRDPALAKLLEGATKWDFVVLQDQSQLPAFAFGPKRPDRPADRKAFEAGGAKLIPLIHRLQPEANIIMFETWARHRDDGKHHTLERFGGKPERMMKCLAQAYHWLVKNPAPGGWDHSAYVRVAPVGEAFERWYAIHGYDDVSLKLQRPDNSHPSSLGAYLTGAVLYETCTGKKCTAVANTGHLKKKKALADELKAVAHRAVEAERHRP